MKQVKKSFSFHPAPDVCMARIHLKIVTIVLHGQWYPIPLEIFYLFCVVESHFKLIEKL